MDDIPFFFISAWVGSVAIGMTFLTSMFTGVAIDKFGIRKTACCGAVLSTVGLLGSSFVEQLEYLYLTYGILLGCGNGLLFAPSLLILGHYFKKRLGLVNGIASFGTAVFSIGLPYLLQYTLRTIGLQQTFYILAAISAMQLPSVLTWKANFHNDELSDDNGTPSKDYIPSPESSITGSNKVNEIKQNKPRISLIWRIINIHIWRNKGYVYWVVGFAVALLGFFIPYIHLVSSL